MKFLFVSLLLFITLLLSGCSQNSEPTTDLAAFPFAQRNLLVLSTEDSCLSVIDIDKKELVGNIKNEHFHIIRDFEVTDQGRLYLPLNGDYNTIEQEVLLLSLVDNSNHSVPVNQAPQKVRSGDEYSLLIHNVTSRDTPGIFNITVMSKSGDRELYSIPIPGLARDAVIENSIAYIALENFQNDNFEIIEFDLKKRKQNRTFPLPANPYNLIISKYHSNSLYISIQNHNEICTDRSPSEIIEIQLDTNASRVITKSRWPDKLLEIDPKHLLVAENCSTIGNHLRKIDINTGEVVQEIDVGVNPSDLISLPDENIAVALNEESKILFIEPSTLEIEAEVQLDCRRPRVLRLYHPQ